MTDSPLEAKLTKKVVDSLNRILELELAGVVRYMHYSFMIFGHNRIPIVAWLRDQSNESNAHAILAGEHITAFGGHPSLKIGSLLETHKHDVNEILKRRTNTRRKASTNTRLLELVTARASCSRNTRATRSRRKRCIWPTSAR
jgi:bacterioferritin